MVCTRKKDYGDAPPPKKRKPSSTRKDTIVVKGPDAVAEAGLSGDTKGMPEKPHNDEQIPYSVFTLFQKLPCELRLTIWEASMTPRLVPAGPKRHFPHSKKFFPALLSVNKESRYCALRHYTLRFTINVTVDQTGLHKWNCPNFIGETHRARVLMSPDDTLGFYGWQRLSFGRRHLFRVESADGTSPWENHPTSHGAQPDVRRVAFLGWDIAPNYKIVHDLNSTIPWDLHSILHKQPGRIRKLSPLCGSWYSASEAAHSKHHVLIHSRNYNGSLQEWGQRLMFRASKGGLALWNGAPDVVAFELGKEPEHGFEPARKLYSDEDENALRLMASYFNCAYRWSTRYPDHRGF